MHHRPANKNDLYQSPRTDLSNIEQNNMNGHRNFRATAATGGSDPWSIALQTLAYADSLERRLADMQTKVKDLEKLSTTDELTCLLNRRGFEIELGRALSLARRHDETGVICFIDLDRFKDINDRFGHEAGDIVLCRVGDILRTFMRASDVIARFAGDEFVVLFLHADVEEAKRRAGELYKLLNNSHANFKGRSIGIQLSMGISEYDNDANAKDLLRRADKAMYRNKHQRRGMTLVEANGQRTGVNLEPLAAAE